MFEEKTLSSKEVYNGAIVKVRVEEVLLPNGETSFREIVSTMNSVGIIAITVDNKILCVKQYRKTRGKVMLEVPAGRIENDDDPLETAKRELLEETGYGKGEFKLLCTSSPSVGSSTSLHYTFLALNVEKVSEQLDLDEDEFLSVHEYTFEQFEKELLSEEVQDLKTAYAYMYLKNYYAR